MTWFKSRVVLFVLWAVGFPIGRLCAQQPPPSSDLGRLFQAAQDGQEAAAVTILDGGVDASAAALDGTTALHVATRAGQSALVNLLLDRGANPMARDGTNMVPLHLSGVRNCGECAKMLLDAGTPVDEVGFTSGDGVADSTALILASEMGAKDVVALLISRGADVNHVNRFERTPLFWAKKAGKTEVAALLEAQGAKADPEEARQAGKTSVADADAADDDEEVSSGAESSGTDSPESNETGEEASAGEGSEGRSAGGESGESEGSSAGVSGGESGESEGSSAGVSGGESGAGVDSGGQSLAATADESGDLGKESSREMLAVGASPVLPSALPSARAVPLTKQAVEALKARLRLNPQDWKARRSLGIHLIQTGDRNLGPKLLASAIKIQPRDPVGRAHLARVLQAMGKTDAALRQYRVVQELDPARARALAKILKIAPR